MMSKFTMAALVGTAGLLSACASSKLLVVRSTPAEADVCIKGTAKSRKFSTELQCIGQTPLELESVFIRDKKGRQGWVKFSDLNPDKDGFYIVLSRPGYLPESFMVPSWEKNIALRMNSPVSVAREDNYRAPPTSNVVEEVQNSIADNLEARGTKAYAESPARSTSRSSRRMSTSSASPNAGAPAIEPETMVGESGEAVQSARNIILDRIPSRIPINKLAKSPWAKPKTVPTKTIQKVVAPR